MHSVHAHDIMARFRAQADPVNAGHQRQYHKAWREYLGLTVPAITRVVRDTLLVCPESDLPRLCRDLWATDVHEARAAVGKILEHAKLGDLGWVWSFLCAVRTDLDGWAIADHLAHGAFRCLREDPSRLDAMEADWLGHDSFWVRRCCLVYTLFLARKGQDPARPLQWASALVDDKEWFIQKAIGWWLRELSKHDPGRVRLFLDRYGPRMKPFARREGAKYLPTAEVS